ncbi:hypothetical protein LIER_16621 [Lithospermum erythrorhizon]|uniref:Reverse transcriptase/retrotransposon-derived protein RNase H-like domain-containing protein n=1 Tax=Lithospermum erythrorhizon TaxID=34254 RepID=A0AAV3QCR7_LITER
MSRGTDGLRERNVCSLEVPKESPKKRRPHEEIWSIPFEERDPKKVFKIGTMLGAKHEEMLIRVLREYRDIFAREPQDMPGVHSAVSVHRLYGDPHYKPDKQKKWTISEEKGEAIREEVGKVLGANAIRELLFPTWLANVVLVLKPNGTWCLPTSTRSAQRIATPCPTLIDWLIQPQGTRLWPLAWRTRELPTRGWSISCAGHTKPKKPEGGVEVDGKDCCLDPVHLSRRRSKLPFFKAIKKRRDFEWTPECEKSFQDLKAYMHSPQLLAPPIDGDALQLYLAVWESSLSSSLIREEDKVQWPVYYVSRLLRGAETRYPLTEKLVFALMVAARKLKPYFESRLVEVITDQPLRKILENPTRSGPMVKWALELSEFELRYKPQTDIKAQSLADFMVECTHGPADGEPELVNLVEATE